jgi:hypothetical protein
LKMCLKPTKMSGYFDDDDDEVFYDCHEQSMMGDELIGEVVLGKEEKAKSSEGLVDTVEMPKKTLCKTAKSTKHLKPSLGKPWKLRRVIGFGRDVTCRKKGMAYVRWYDRVKQAKEYRRSKKGMSAWKLWMFRRGKSVLDVLASGLAMFGNIGKSLILPDGTSNSHGEDDVPDLEYHCKSHVRPVLVPHKRMNVGVISLLLSGHCVFALVGFYLCFFCAPAGAMDFGDGEKSLSNRFPQFTGSKNDFVMWLAKFTAVATMGLFVSAIQQNTRPSDKSKFFGEKDCPKTAAETAALDEAKDQDKPKIKAWSRNNKAFAALTLCMPNKLFRFIASADGMAWRVMEMLYEEYKPDDNMSHVEAERQYAAIKLTNNGNPKYLRQRFAQIAAEYPSAAAEEPKKIAIILWAAPAMYQSMLAMQQIAKGSACTSSNLLDAMEMLYRQQGGTQRINNDDGGELAMAAPGNRAPVCWNCGKPGHKVNVCRSPNTNNKFRPARSNNSNSKSNRGRDDGGNNGNANGDGNNNGNRNNRDIVCNECGMRGHTRDRCFCLESNASRRPAGWRLPAGYQRRNNGSNGGNNGGSNSGEQAHANMDYGNDDCYELLMCQVGKQDKMTFPKVKALLEDPNIWIGDTGASTHSTSHKKGMVNLRRADSTDNIQVGNSEVNRAEYIGDVPGTLYDQYGEAQSTAMLKNVTYSKDNAFNLVSIPQLLMKGWKLQGETDSISVTSPAGQSITFDIVIPTKKGRVYAVCFKRQNEIAAIHADGKEEKIPPTLSVNQAHAKFGHCSEALARSTAQQLHIKLLRGSFRPCTACGMGKAKQKNVPKSVESEQPSIGERMHGDICTIKKKEDNKKYVRPNWFMLIDAATGMKFSSFWTTKSEFIEPTCELMHGWINRGIGLKKIRCDNAKENKAWEARCKSADWKLPVQFEYTAARTPQQNSKVEVGFAVIANRGCALLAAANVPATIR